MPRGLTSTPSRPIHAIRALRRVVRASGSATAPLLLIWYINIRGDIGMSVKRANYGSAGKNVLGALLALLLSVAGDFAISAPAAAAAPSDCASGLTCSYSGYDYGNDAFQQPSTHKFANCVDAMYIGWRSYKNVISSTYNNGRSQNSYLYRGENQQGGAPLFLARGSGKANVGSFNDDIESGYFDTTRGSVGSALCR